MPRKRKDNEPKQIDTRNKVFNWWKRRRNKIITIVLAVIIAIAGIVGWSVYSSQSPYNQVAITVNGSELNMRYFINTLKLYYGTAPAGQHTSEFPDWVEQQIELNETIRWGALALGIQIERNEIEEELKKSNIPVTRERVDMLMAKELIAKGVPANQPQVHLKAMLLESKEAAQLAKSRMQNGETFEDVAAELSKETITRYSDGDLGWVTKLQVDLLLESEKLGEIAFSSDIGVLNGPVYDDTISKDFGFWVIRATEKVDASDSTPARLLVHGILLGTEEEARDVMVKLDSGEDFNELAEQVSQYPGFGDSVSELGWITWSEGIGDFDILFDLPLNTISGPIGDSQMETMGGYWVFNVIQKNNDMALTAEQKSKLEKDFIDRCTAEAQKDTSFKIENLLTQEMKDLALNEAVLAQGKGSVLVGTRSLPDAEVGVNYSETLLAYGNQHSNTWSITQGRLPTGLSLDGSTGLISGIPESAGGAGFTIEVNSGLKYNRQEFFIIIHSELSLMTSSLPDGQVGEAYNERLMAVSGSGIYTWSIIEGSLPPGLSLEESIGTISGTPTTVGTYIFTAQVDDGLKKVTQELSISIK